MISHIVIQKMTGHHLLRACARQAEVVMQRIEEIKEEFGWTQETLDLSSFVPD